MSKQGSKCDWDFMNVARENPDEATDGGNGMEEERGRDGEETANERTCKKA